MVFLKKHNAFILPTTEKNTVSELPLCMCFTLSQLHTERAAHTATPCKICLDVFAIIYTQKKRKKKKEHLSHVGLKEELEKLTSQAHFSSLVVSSNKQFS